MKTSRDVSMLGTVLAAGLGLMCGALLPVHSALAQGAAKDTSVIILCRELVDGQPSPSCALEPLVLETARAEGAILIAADQAERVRKQLTPASWEDPAALKGFNMMDAQQAWLLTTDANAQGGLGKFKSYSVAMTLKVVVLGNANILFETRLETPGTGLNAQAALMDARKRLAAKAWPDAAALLREKLAAPAVAELWVFDVPDLGAAGQVETLLTSQPGVASAKRTAFANKAARWRVELAPGKDVGWLSGVLEGADSPLSVQGVVGPAVQAAWRPAARLKMTAAVNVRSGSAAPPWFQRVMVDLVSAQLRSSGYIQVLPAGGASPALDVGVHVAKVKERFAVTLTASHGKGKPLATVVESALEDELPAATQRGVSSLLAAFQTWLQKSPQDLLALRDALAAPVALGAVLELDEKGATLFGARAQEYAGAGIGVLKLSQPMQDVHTRVRVGAGAWMDAPVLPRGDHVRIPLPVTPAQLTAFTRPTSLTVEVEATASAGERLFKVATSTPVLVYPVQAMRWSQPETFLAFIHPTAPWARTLAASLPPVDSDVPSTQLGRAQQLWDAFQRKGFRYLPDARAPFAGADLDTVELPPVTLALGGGDCDDLTAALATAVEAAGIPTRLIKLPGHVMLAVDSGLPATAWPRLAASQDAVLLQDGRVFLPVETTATPGTFWDAVQAGGKRLAAARKEALVMDPRQGWLKHPPLEQTGQVVFQTAQEQPRLRVLVAGVKSPSDLEDAAAQLAGDVTAALAKDAGLEVASQEDVKRMAQLRAMQMSVGCDAPECLTDLGRGLAARLLVTGRLDKLNGQQVLSLSMLDVGSMAVVGTVDVTAPDASQLKGKTAQAASALLARLHEGGARQGTAASSQFKQQWAAVEAKASQDPYAKARWLAVQGKLVEARQAAKSVKDAGQLALLNANLDLMEGHVEQAQAALTKTPGKAAAWNRAVARCMVVSDDACKTGLQAIPAADVQVWAGAGTTATTVASGAAQPNQASLDAVAALAAAYNAKGAAKVEAGQVGALLLW